MFLELNSKASLLNWNLIPIWNPQALDWTASICEIIVNTSLTMDCITQDYTNAWEGTGMKNQGQ